MIAIVDYGMGNLHSVAKAVERLGYQAEVVEGPDRLQNARHNLAGGRRFWGCYGAAKNERDGFGVSPGCSI